MERERLEAGAAWLGAAVVLAIAWTRPWDDGLFRAAARPGGWLAHVDRLEAAQGFGLEWLRGLDRQYPPGLHAVGSRLGSVVGHSAEAVLRGWAIWSLLLIGATAAVAGRFGGWRGAAGAACVVASLPAVHASAFVYHHELLQFSLIWAAVAALIRVERAAVAGPIAGLLLAASCLVKWTAPAFFGPVVAVVVLGRWRALLLAGLVCSVALDGWLRVSTVSLQNMLVGSWGAAVQPLEPRGLVVLLDAVRALAGGHGLDPGYGPWDRLFLPFRLVVGTLSPVLMLGVVAGWARWRGEGRAFVLASALLMAAAMQLLPLLDDRWLLMAAPVLAVPAGLAWARSHARGWTLGIWIGAAALVAADFHHVEREGEVRFLPSLLPEHFTWAGAGAVGSSDRGSGWVRRDHRAGAPFLPQREQAWAAAAACGSMLVDDPRVQGETDPTWFHYRNLLARQRGRPFLDVVSTSGQLYSGSVEPRPARAVVTVEGSGIATAWPIVGRWPRSGAPTVEVRCAPSRQKSPP